MKELRDEVYFTDGGVMIQATWGLIVHYAWEYTGDLKLFTEYTDEEVWKELQEVGIEHVSEDDFNTWVEEHGEDDIEYWVITENDKISQLSSDQYNNQ